MSEEHRARGEYDYEIVNSKIKPIAEALIRKFDELSHLNPDSILFIRAHKGGSKKTVTLARTSRISEKWRDLLEQIGAASYTHTVEFMDKATVCLDENQMVALVYRELRQIAPEGEIRNPDIHEWWQILMGLGRRWFYPDESCPNLLDDEVDWKKLMGSSYEPPRDEE
jgi:hypothetical protein